MFTFLFPSASEIDASLVERKFVKCERILGNKNKFLLSSHRTLEKDLIFSLWKIEMKIFS